MRSGETPKPRLWNVMTGLPPYLDVPPAKLGDGTPVRVRVVGDVAAIAGDFAEVLLREIREGAKRGRGATFIVPVGPVDQFPVLAEMINKERVDCRDVCLINMDEYLTDEDRWIDIELSAELSCGL